MQIIVSHQLTDLDGLGAMVAARKLYPEAQVVLPGRLHRLARDFLVLYKDEINLYYLEEIDLTSIDRVIIVDTHQREMLGRLYELIDWTRCEVILYDHHPHGQLDWVNLDLSEDVGSATTILVNKIRSEGLILNPFEATLCALAIYADTGNLTYLKTTSRDAQALAYLLDSGANLKIINEFIKEALNEEQQALLEDLIDNRVDLQIDGIKVSLFSISYDKYVVGINRVVEQLKRLYHLPSIFVLVQMNNKVEIIGRSSDEAVDIGKICSLLGGGGHAGAGAASVKADLGQARKTLIQEIKRNVHPQRRVRTIMSSPVRTVKPDTPIEEVEELLKKYGHNGLVVYDGEEIKGIFSRRDLNKVKGHGLHHAPVKAYMTRDVVTVPAEASIQKAQELMVKHGVGRLPVTEGKKLVGIVTRSDLLASYYGSETPYQHKNRYGSSLVQIKQVKRTIASRLTHLPGECLTILREVGRIASDYQARVYLIGGAVRDLFLNKGIKDLDIVIEGGELKGILTELSKELHGDYTFNEHFQTGTVKLQNGYSLDLAQARRERYFYPGALPEVESTDILEDLFRRDYTVNALALNISPSNWGELIDFFEGYKDIKRRLLRVLHRFSFLDDPTRIIRGIRLASELGFKFEGETRELIEEALTMGDFSRLAPVRVIKEFKLLFKERVTPELLKLLAEIPAFRLLNLDISISQSLKEEFKELESYLQEFSSKGSKGGIYDMEDWVLRFALFMDNVPRREMENWGVKESYKDILASYQGNYYLYQDLQKEMGPVELVRLLDNLSIEEILVLLVKTGDKQVKTNLKKYLELIQIETFINGNDLLEMGLKPGPVIRKILDEVYQARLKGAMTTREEEIAYARKIMKDQQDTL